MLSANALYSDWSRWFLSDRATRSIAPGFMIAPAETEKLAKDLAGTAAGAMSRFAPTLNAQSRFAGLKCSSRSGSDT